MSDPERYAVVCENCGALGTYEATTWKTAEEAARIARGNHARHHDASVHVEPASGPILSDETAREWLHFLTPIQREDFEAVRLGDRCAREQARVRGVNPQAVRRSIRRATERLRRVAADRGEVAGRV